MSLGLLVKIWLLAWDVKVYKKNGIWHFSARKPMYNPAEARMIYGDKLKELLNRHKVVHEEILETDENGNFRGLKYVVGGPGPHKPGESS